MRLLKTEGIAMCRKVIKCMLLLCLLSLAFVQRAWTEEKAELTLSRLVYDRKYPEQGFVLTTEEKKSK